MAFFYTFCDPADPDTDMSVFSDGCEYNTAGSYCVGNSFGELCQYITLANYSRENAFDAGVRYVSFQGTTAATEAQPAKNYHVPSGVEGAEGALIDVNPVPGRNYVTFVGYNSSGALKQYCPMDGAE